MTTERWVSVMDYPKYEISSNGRIRSTNGILSLQLHPRGYMTVWLSGKKNTHLVHKLVLQSFVGPRPPGYQVAHNDGIRTNNRLDNLRWASVKDNIADKKKHGRHQAGEAHPRARLSQADVNYIRKYHVKRNYKTKAISNTGELASKFGIKYCTVRHIVNGLIWKEPKGNA